MSEKKAVGVRARVRAELTAEIKQAATRQLASDGASGLSLRAIARELGMASSAIYRYFASRDELLTALIIDAYNAAGQAVEDAVVQCGEYDHAGRFVAVCSTLRRWAIDNPHEWALIYGSPVPGYAAPQDTIDPATRIPVALLTLLVESRAGESASQEPAAETPAEADLRAALADLLVFTGSSVEPSALSLGVEAWGELVGLISLELFGHLNNAVTDPGVHFEHAVKKMADRVLGR